MSQIVGDVLIEAINDEYKARATYRHVIKQFGKIRPFVNILEAESRHVEALLPLFHKYGVTIPEDDWDSRVVVPQSVKEACQAGVDAEIANAKMYERLIQQAAEYPDIQQVLEQLKRASAENHLPAFRRCVERGGHQGQGWGHGRCRSD
ncbi:MAG: hypothetical protein Tsb002_10590 [Wenzhouxiangellaceae bacterium]